MRALGGLRPPLLAPGVAIVFLGLLSGEARAQSVEDGRRLYLEAEFDAARDAFAAVLDRPSVDVAQAAEAHRYLAALYAVLRDEGATRRHAEAAVALDPAVTAPAGAPSALGALLDEVRRETGGARATLHIGAEDGVRPAEPARVRLALDPAPEALASTLRLRCVSGTESAEERGAPPSVEVELTVAGDEVNCGGTAYTRGGAPLLSATEVLEPAPRAETGDAAVLVPAEDDGSDGSALPWLLVGGAAVVAAAVVVAVILIGGDGERASLGEPRIQW
jgi:hypothetical protein